MILTIKAGGNIYLFPNCVSFNRTFDNCFLFTMNGGKKEVENSVKELRDYFKKNYIGKVSIRKHPDNKRYFILELHQLNDFSSNKEFAHCFANKEFDIEIR